MEKYTKEQRNKIYNAVLNMLINGGSKFICPNIIWQREVDINAKDFNVLDFPELCKHKPIDKEYTQSWFNSNEEGVNKRIEILRQAIEETKTN